MWVKVTDNLSVRCVRTHKKQKKYCYESKNEGNDEVIIVCYSDNSPAETSNRSEFFQFIKRILKADGRTTDYIENEFINIRNKLNENIVVEYDASAEERKSAEEIESKYIDLYSEFNYFLEEYDMTPLELIVATSHCLGVGKPREIIRAWIGYFQTYIGYKGTNVIAIGSPASGKSFILESALNMIPEERLIYGCKTVAYFFNKYNGRDMTGYIFFLGDLGGSDDDIDTIKFRDKLKVLSTDGYIERGVMEKDSMEEEEQYVEGYPCLSYSTAVEEMVNDQEKTRSILLSPLPVDSGKLVVYNFLMENNGAYTEELEKLYSIRESIKGLVYNFNPDDYDWFNPYMFCIEEHLREHDDFNRKILEYNAILKIVTILNSPRKLNHEMYLDDDNLENKNTTVYISSMRDNINALNIFDSANLLPDESRFANGIIESYESYKLPVLDGELWEDIVREEIDDNINDDNGYIEFDAELRKHCFTLKSLTSEHRFKKWYRKSANYKQERIDKLVEENIIVNIGKELGTRHNVYCLNKGMESSVDSPLPNFRSKQNIDKANNLFRLVFPDQYDEYLEFLSNDNDVDTTDLFEQIPPIISDLPYLDGVYDEL